MVCDIIVIAQGGSHMEKEILAALEIADHEVRLLIGQFYNGRLNILKVEKVDHQGVSDYTITDENLVVEAIKKAIENASRNMGVVIEKVLLLIPGVQMQHETVEIDISISGKITENDAKRAYRKLLEKEPIDDYVLSNVLISKYFVNGSSSRKLPLKERCKSMTVEAECYYIREDIIFPYVSEIEISGLKIIDIVLDDIAFGKEASLFESSINQPIIVYTLTDTLTKMSLYYQGKFLSNDYELSGFDTYMNQLKNKFDLPKDTAKQILYYNLDLVNSAPKKDPIFLWSTKGVTNTISSYDVSDTVVENIKEYLDELLDRSEPIFNMGKPKIYVTGEASVMDGLPQYLSSKSQSEVKHYRAMTFGIKDPSFSALVGAFYFYKDYEVFRDSNQFSADQDEFKRNVLKHDDSEQNDYEEESMTHKLKKIFLERK